MIRPVLLLGAALSAPALAEPLVIDHVTLIDAAHGERRSMQVIIEGDRITAVRPASSGGRPEERYLIPGLWDAHVHITESSSMGQLMLNHFLATGITSVRDTGGLLEPSRAWKEQIAEDPLAYPEVYMAGPLLDGEMAVYDGHSESYPHSSRSLLSAEEAEQAVDEIAAAGMDFVKAYEMITPEVFEAIMAGAQRHELAVAGHIPLAMDAVTVSRQGLDSIEHLRNVEISCSPDERRMIDERRTWLERPEQQFGSDLRMQAHRAHRNRAAQDHDWQRCVEVLAIHKANGTLHTPTYALMLAVYEPFHHTAQWHQTFADFPGPLRLKWQEQSTARKAWADSFVPTMEGLQAYLAWVKKVIAHLANDSMLMAGTDTPLWLMTPGYSLHKELEALVTAGLTPLQALEAATLTPARFFGLEAESGSIAPGQRANLVLLRSNPLEDIRNTRDIETVVRGGKVYDRIALDALLAQTREMAWPEP